MLDIAAHRIGDASLHIGQAELKSTDGLVVNAEHIAMKFEKGLLRQ